MAISTYSELQTAVASWLARDDLTARIPEFITLAEAKLNRELRCRQMEQRSTTSADTTDSEPEFISLPSDFQTMRRIRLTGVSGKPRLLYLSGSQIDEYRYRQGNSAGTPTYYSIVGTEIELLPTPDDDYEIEMVYRKNIPALSSSEPTNWLLALAPDAYLYGALLESAPYIDEDARIATWGLGFKVAIDGLNRLPNEVPTSALEIRSSGPTP